MSGRFAQTTEIKGPIRKDSVVIDELDRVSVDMAKISYLVTQLLENITNGNFTNTTEEIDKLSSQLSSHCEVVFTALQELAQVENEMDENNQKSFQKKLRRYYQLVSTIELILYKIGIGEEYNQHTHAVVEDFSSDDARYNQLKIINEQKNFGLPDWIIEYSNRILELKASYNDLENHFKELDDDYGELMVADRHTPNEKLFLTTLMAELILRTACHKNDKIYEDAATNLNMIKNLGEEIIEVWKNFSVITNKYKTIRYYSEKIVELLSTYFIAA